MSDGPSTLKVSSKREKNEERRQIFILLAKLYELGTQWVPDVSERRKEFVNRIKQKLNQKGR